MRLMLVTAVLALSACHPSASGHSGTGDKALANLVDAPASAGIKGVHREFAGTPMPAAMLKAAGDKDATLASAAGGQPMLVNLWAAWCGPCVKELPTLQALSHRPGAPRLIAVSEDDATRAAVDAFAEDHQLGSVTSWRDPDLALSGSLNTQVLPTTIYYGADGKERWRYVGDTDWTGAEAAQLLAATR